MPRGIMYVETMPVSSDREAEYHTWYNDTHLAQILSVQGIVSARRFAPNDGAGPFIAIYSSTATTSMPQYSASGNSAPPET